jgi:hypothetical protein
MTLVKFFFFVVFPLGLFHITYTNITIIHTTGNHYKHVKLLSLNNQLQA